MPRIRYGGILRVIITLALFFVLLQIMLAASNPSLDKFEDVQNNLVNREEELMNSNDTSEQVMALVPPELHKYLTIHARNSTGNSTEIRTKNITEIKKQIQLYNEAQYIYNEDIYGPVQNDTVIIAIQVHTRLTYLRHLIVSLAQAQDIDKTLLIFSHDFYDEDINYLVRSIDFTKVMQIFYPFSIQTHPHEFPGVDPNDCPRDAKIEQAKKMMCNNALHPDIHKHYREAKYTQTKHHWWWKANRIFNQLQCTAHHTGMVVFLEEDHYVAEDFLQVLGLMRSTADKSCPQCEILCLGTYLKTYNYYLNGNKRKKVGLSYLQIVNAANEERKHRQEGQSWNFQVYPHLYGYTQKVEITPWYSSMHNMGMVLNRTIWTEIVKSEQQFCAYDDYNWDYSLFHLSQNRAGKEKFKVMVCKGPRVFHIGECGFHHKKPNCNASTVIGKVQKLLLGVKKYMFPSRLAASISAGRAKQIKKTATGNGGWGDLRDQELCSNMTKIGRQPKKTYLT